MLYDDPPHRVTVYSSTSGADAGGGVQLTYTAGQSAVPCLINTASSNEAALFAQQGITVSHTVSFLSSALTTALARGMKLVSDDDGASYHVEGIRQGRAVGGIPALVYAQCRQLLG